MECVGVSEVSREHRVEGFDRAVLDAVDEDQTFVRIIAIDQDSNGTSAKGMGNSDVSTAVSWEIRFTRA